MGDGLSARWAGGDRVAWSCLLIVSVLALAEILCNFVYNFAQLCFQSCATLFTILYIFVYNLVQLCLHSLSLSFSLRLGLSLNLSFSLCLCLL